MKICCQNLAALLCGAVLLCGQAALASGPGCATCNGGGVGYAAAPLHMGVPADVSYGQLAPTDWNAPASRAGCCVRPQRDMCDWWAGYCDTQRVLPCPSGDCNYGKRGWGEGYLGSSLCGGCQRACNNIGHGRSCGCGCKQSCCAPACNSCGSCNDCCAPACGSGCGSSCGSCCGGSSLSGFFGGFGSMFSGGHCSNVIGGSSGTAYCGCCPPRRCGHGCGGCGDCGCSAPCGKAPCRARQTWNGGCCNSGMGDGHYAAPVSNTTDSYYPETGASNSSNYSTDVAPSQDSSPSLQPMELPAPSNGPVPTPARPMPEAQPLDISVPAPRLNNANRDADGFEVAPPDSEADSI